MKRRRFIRIGSAVAVGAGVAGCISIGGSSGGGEPWRAPPRDARVFGDVSVEGSTMQVPIVDDPEVESRIDEVNADVGAADGGAAAGLAASLLPVGRARAVKGGRGATGRGSGGYSSAPRGRHGWAVWHGKDDDYDEWEENNDDETRMYDANVAMLGVTWLGTADEYADSAPGPGDEALDTTWSDPEEGSSYEVNVADLSPGGSVKPGWYRVETKLESEDGSTNFGRQAADLKVDTDGNASIEKGWHVRPRV